MFQRLIFGFAALLSFGSSSWAKEILFAVIEDASGERSAHHQAIEGAACRQLLDEFIRLQKSGEQMTLTFMDPDFTGVVLHLACVDETGKIFEAGPKR